MPSWSKRGVSPPPPYSSTYDDLEATSSFGMPPRHHRRDGHNERTPLLIHQQRIVTIIRNPRNVVIRVERAGYRVRFPRHPALAIFLLGTTIFLAAGVVLLSGFLPYFLGDAKRSTPPVTYNVAIVGELLTIHSIYKSMPISLRYHRERCRRTLT